MHICSHVWPIKLIPIEHNIVAMTIDDASDMNVTAKGLQAVRHGRFTHIHL